MRGTEGTIGQHQNKIYNSNNLDHQSTQKTKEIYSKHHRMATHHWIIVCGTKHHVQVGDYNGVWESGQLKIDEEGDEDGDVDEDDHRDDGSPSGTPTPPRERGSGSPLCDSSSMASHLDGARFFLWSLASMTMVTPPASSSMASGDVGPLRQGAREGLDWFFVATKAYGGGTPDLRFFSGGFVFIGIFGVGFTSRGSTRRPQGRSTLPGA